MNSRHLSLHKLQDCIKKIQTELDEKECYDVFERQLSKLSDDSIYSLISDTIKNQMPKVLSMILKHKPDLRLKKYYIVLASETNNPEIVKILLEAGADPNHIEFNTGRFPLNSTTNKEVVKLLLEAGADPNIHLINKNSPLIYFLVQEMFVKISPQDNYDILKMLLDAGADPNRTDRYGEPPLIFAETLQNVNLLIDYGADVDYQNLTSFGTGNTPLIFFTDQDDYEIVRLLLSKGANPWLKANGKIALEWAKNDQMKNLIKSYMEPIHA